MTELLAPAGNMEALKAAVSNGCNAVYLGMQKFGARAYSENFDYDLLKEAVDYAHLRDVKIFVTMNTIVFEAEIEDMKEQLHKLKGCQAHLTVIPASVDKNTYAKLGMNLTCEPIHATKKLYHKS